MINIHGVLQINLTMWALPSGILFLGKIDSLVCSSVNLSALQVSAFAYGKTEVQSCNLANHLAIKQQSWEENSSLYQYFLQ